MGNVYPMGMTIRETLLRAFNKSGMTYGEFATAAGMTIPSAHRKLNGKTPTTLEEAQAYARILNVKISATLKKGR